MGDVSTRSISVYVDGWSVRRCNHDVARSHPKVNAALGLRCDTAQCFRQYLNRSVKYRIVAPDYSACIHLAA